MKTICLFDLDGTLTDSKPGIINSATHALKAMGVTSSSYSGSQDFLIGPPIRDALRLIHPFSDEEVEEVILKYREYYSKKGMLENTVYPGIMELLAKLQSEGITMAIATSKAVVYAKRIAEHFGFKQYFGVIMGAELDGTREHKSEVITAALKQLGADKSHNIIMIGDREHDILGARGVNTADTINMTDVTDITNIVGIGVTWGYGSRQELEAAGAKTVVDTTDELYHAIQEYSR